MIASANAADCLATSAAVTAAVRNVPVSCNRAADRPPALYSPNLIMPTLAFLRGRTGREMGSRALMADSVETWVCAYLSVALLATVGLNAAFGWWADPIGALAMLPVIVWQGWSTKLGPQKTRNAK
jgi:hypothetical protein